MLHLQLMFIIDFFTLHGMKFVVNLHLYVIGFSYLLLVTEIVSEFVFWFCLEDRIKSPCFTCVWRITCLDWLTLFAKFYASLDNLLKMLV